MAGYITQHNGEPRNRAFLALFGEVANSDQPLAPVAFPVRTSLVPFREIPAVPAGYGDLLPRTQGSRRGGRRIEDIQRLSQDLGLAEARLARQGGVGLLDSAGRIQRDHREVIHPIHQGREPGLCLPQTALLIHLLGDICECDDEAFLG